jgi:hypothetical protein
MQLEQYSITRVVVTETEHFNNKTAAQDNRITQQGSTSFVLAVLSITVFDFNMREQISVCIMRH